MEASLMGLVEAADHYGLAPPEPELDESWSKEEDQQFEYMLSTSFDLYPNGFKFISGCLPSKTLDQVVRRYNKLVADVQAIDAGLVPFPEYKDHIFCESVEDAGQELRNVVVEKREKKRRNPAWTWSAAEHKLFLEGLDKLGRGDWRGISRQYVTTKTPTQVASHAQKYFLRHSDRGNSATRRRRSIHDITLDDGLTNQQDQVTNVEQADVPNMQMNQDSQNQQDETQADVPYMQMNKDLPEHEHESGNNHTSCHP